MLKWTTAIAPFSKFPDGTVLLHDAHLRGTYRDFLRFHLTGLAPVGPIRGLVMIPLIWLAGGFFSGHWIASTFLSVPIFIGILFFLCFVLPHLERRRILQGRKAYKILIDKRGIGLDRSQSIADERRRKWLRTLWPPYLPPLFA